MEVRKVGKVDINKVQNKSNVPQESVSFQEVIGKQRQNALYDKMTQWVKDIEDQGKVLSENRTVDNLRKYKKMVKDFMDEAVANGLQLEEQRGFNRRGRTKIYKIVKEVDKALIDLTNITLDKERSTLDILAKCGEIKGLLVNVYT